MGLRGVCVVVNFNFFTLNAVADSHIPTRLLLLNATGQNRGVI